MYAVTCVGKARGPASTGGIGIDVFMYPTSNFTALHCIGSLTHSGGMGWSANNTLMAIIYVSGCYCRIHKTHSMKTHLLEYLEYKSKACLVHCNIEMHGPSYDLCLNKEYCNIIVKQALSLV